ncbi:MAG: hypothetical protein Q9227_008710 [Pyrenula ochraceoflavens]
MAKFSQFGLVAAAEALQDAGWMPQTDEEKERTGPTLAPSTACTTSAHALSQASQLIHLSETPLLLAGGAESCIHPLALSGFARSRSLATSFNSTPHLASRPFDSRREGFVMGEGAAILVLEDLEHALNRGAPKIYAELLGSANTSDAHHMTSPPEDGRGAYGAMKAALQRAGLSPSDVSYINAHATSTPLGDLAENRAIRRLMVEDGGVEEGRVVVGSNKGQIGHLLGAAGAAEAVFTVLSLKEGVVPPTGGLEEVGEGMAGFEYVMGEKREMEVEVAVTNSFGFGGTNGSLVFGKWKGV